MKIEFILALVLGAFLSMGIAFAVENKGAASMVLQGGSSGDVPFPHHKHQNALGDCNLCHNLFPQEPGGVEKLKAEGRLKKKAVMEQCKSCHRKRTDKGERGGPVGCKACHRK